MPERRTHNYIRHGTLDLFAALNVATGEVIARSRASIARRTSSRSCAKSTASVAPELDIHVVLDNLSAHKAPRGHALAASRHPRFHFHFTRPTRRG